MENSPMNQPSSLCQSSAFLFSKQLWAQPEIKQLVIQCIEEDKLWVKYEVTELQKTLRTEISRKIDECLLPMSVKRDVRFIVESMGMRLQRWAKAIRKNKPASVDLALYIDHIRWTDYGCINRAETIRAMYHSQLFPETSDTWLELSEHCLEDCLIDLRPKVSENGNHKPRGTRTIMSSYWCCQMLGDPEEDLEDLKEVIFSYNHEYSLEENMLIFLFPYGNYSAVKYFWRLLNDGQKKRTLVELMNDLSFPSMSGVQDLFYGEHDGGLDYVVFLMQQLSSHKVNHLWSVLMQNEHVSQVLIQLLKWPCQDLFLDKLKQSWEHQGKLNYTPILLWLSESIESLHSTDGADSLYREILYNIWEDLISEFRGSVDFMEILCTLWAMREVNWLKHIINDKRLETMRINLVFYIKQLFAGYPESESAYFEEFIARVLVSEEEREKFRIDVALASNPPRVIEN